MKKLLLLCALFAGLQLRAFDIDRLFAQGYNLGEDSLGLGLNAIPDGQSGVTALTLGRDGNIYGGTSSTNGRSAWVFIFRRSNAIAAGVTLAAKIKAQPLTHNALTCGHDGYIYGGTSAYHDTLFTRVAQWVNPKYEGGHLFRFKEGSLSSLEDLGIVMPHEGIRTIAVDTARRKIYGLTEPTYRFFIYDINLKKTTVRSDVDLLRESENLLFSTRLNEPGKALAVAPDGRVYGSAGLGVLFCYSPKTDKLEITDIAIPHSGDYGATVAVSAFAVAPDSTLYGGTTYDGVLFRFDPARNKMWNLGKPTEAGFIHSLCFAGKGDLVGTVGEARGIKRVFRYREGSFEITRFPQCNVMRAQYRAYAQELAPLVYCKEGMLVFGNGGRIGKLFTWTYY